MLDRDILWLTSYKVNESLDLCLHPSINFAACQSPLGMESGVIQSSQLSVGGGISYLPDMNKLRYNHPEGWCSIMITEGSFNPGRYIEIALKSDSKISALLLQKGNGKYGSYGYGDKIRLQWRDSKTSFFGYFKDRVGPDVCNESFCVFYTIQLF